MTTDADSATKKRAAGQSAPPPAIEFHGISKSFGPVRANHDVSMTIAAGCIHGIVGENGAGKSTLMSILYGFYEADRGEIKVAGQAVNITSPDRAIAAGIGMVHQHFMLVDTFTVLENIILGAERGLLLADSIAAAGEELKRLEAEYDLYVDPEAVIQDLPVGALQRVEILKALYRGAKILILDEPTGVLTPQETDQLFRILQALKAQGGTVILITHKLREIMAITDTVSVMRHGRVVADKITAETSEAELAELMVGRKIRSGLKRTDVAVGKVALRVRHLTVRDAYRVPRVDDVSFEIRTHEIVGIAGVSGNGQSELLEVLAGILPVAGGGFEIAGRRIMPDDPCDPAQLRTLGLAHVPEDRQRLGMVAEFSAKESAILGYQNEPLYQDGIMFNQAAIAEKCAALMARFDVRPPLPAVLSANFSGGNQQKLILARELDRAPDVLLVGQPTRGVDIGAVEFIHRQLIDMRDQGCAILLVSVELEEIMALSDRILVMFEGRIVAELPAVDADERTLGLMMANAAAATA
ncbi:MAG: ABC transporter ATP-binding protein [Proteobacteria bacterium]|nr:ABC transporter ATP-binding protein [Pseudomonadota bacterium]